MGFTQPILLLFTLFASTIAERECVDEHGRKFEHDREWRSMDGNFVKKCEVFAHGWQIKVVSCASKSNHRIEIGGKRVEGPMIWYCDKSSNGGVSLRSEPNPDAECNGGHLPGSRWVDGAFERECQAGAHAKIVGCVSPGGTRITLGDSIEEKGDIVICEKRPDGSISMRNERNPNAFCGDHPAGSEWVEESFVMKCEAGGRSEIVGCQLPSGERIGLNDKIHYKGYIIYCQQFENGTHRIFSEPDPTAECDGGHPAGSKWIENTFEKECLPGALTKTTGCALDDGQRIPLGGRTEFGKFLAFCNNNNNGTVSLTLDVNPNAPCGEHLPGARWVERSFEKECKIGGNTEIVSCVTSTRQRVPLNGHIVLDGQKVHCEKLQDGTVWFHGEPDPNASCQGGHEAGTRWIDKGFELECAAGGRTKVAGCISPQGNYIAVGSEERYNQFVYACEEQPDGSVRFRSKPIVPFAGPRKRA
ncbi:unnamed protein product [Bursaphelenchus xylophilus]|uniref:(pine wood nematode) hypothetical protein n=1 Tax=Bursaphelenchus xylophilus TaxID=6326 RepID=A0A1I7S2J0_BURXY|nr:unnamed protein product [Bursaphelenchus xylophilus]CAG9121919.1 unnamed protein product [Bursaphelenchus xylophilus]